MQSGMERIDAYTRPPWWKLEAATMISLAKKDEAAKDQQRLRQIPT
jgi:hypothetical protein